MRNYLREARLDLSGNYLGAICASMLYFVVAYAIIQLTLAIPVSPVFKGLIGLLLFIFVIIPTTMGYVHYLKYHKDMNFPSPKVLFRFNTTFIKVVEVLVCVFMAFFFILSLLVCAEFIVLILVPSNIRIATFFAVTGILALVYLILGVIAYLRLWPLFFLAEEKADMSFTYYIKTCFKLTKGKNTEYLKFVLRFWRLFLVCILPFGLGLLAFFPIFTVAQQKYFDTLMGIKRDIPADEKEETEPESDVKPEIRKGVKAKKPKKSQKK